MPHSRSKRTRPAVLRATPLATALLTAGLLPLAANAQLTGAAAAPVPLSSPWGLSLAPQLEEHVVPVGQSPARFVLGDKAQGNIDKDVSVLGHGELRGGATFVKGDRLHYDMDTDVADAYGNVRLTNQGNTFTGPEAHMKLGATEGYMVSPAYHFNLTGGSGKAQRIDVLDPERSVVERGTYTGCACSEDPAWYIRGSRFDFDTGTNSGTARNGVLFFQGVPIFASPYLSFPLNNDRRSGLLPPTMAVSSSAGVDITTPYYFNIAPNRDFTLTPRVMSQRGVQLGGTYRYLSPTYSGTTTVEYLPHDAIKKSERYAIFLQHAQNFGGGFGGYINYNRVSDSTYPEDLSSSNNLFVTGTQLLYQQEAGLTYANGPWSVLARVQKWQTLPPSISPYERVPQLNVGYHKFDVGGFDYGAEADYTRFRVNTLDMPEGQRVYLNPYVSYPIIRPDYFFVPKVQYHLAAYDLSAQGSGITGVTGSRRQSVAIPTASIDTGLIFERPVRLFGQDYIQTLEPRLYYVYTPFRDQSHIPVFDTAESDFGLAEIFTENTYVGNDRVADANRLTAGITTRFINPTTGDERARFVFAQQYYFTDQRTVIPGQPLAQATHSDLILGASLKLGQGFASETAIQYNADNNQLVRSNIGFGWSPADRKVLNMAYRYTRASTTLFNQPISQAVMSAQWPLMRRLYAVGRLNFDIRSHRLVDGLLGFQYDADCWAFGVALQRYANGIEAGGRNATGSRILAQLELKGFSHIDNGLVQQFRASVPGYMPPPPGAPPLSRFSQYQ